MPVKITMPALSPTMEEGKITQWLVATGEAVKSGDVLAEIETDKAIVELEALDDGRLGKIVHDAGPDKIKVNELIAVLLFDDEDNSVLDNLDMTSPAVAPDTDKPTGTDKPTDTDKPTGTDKPTDTPSAPGLQATENVAPRRIDVPADTNWRSVPVREALRDAMAEEMRRDEAVFVMGEEVAEYQGAYKVTQGLLDEFGSMRVIDTPITEHAIAGLGVGAAFAGLRPIVEFMTFNFAMQAIDQIVNSAAKTRYMSGGQISCPIVFRGPNGVASRVAAQHSQDYASWYAHIPGLVVLAPYTAADAKGLLKTAIRSDNPVVFLEHEMLYGLSGDVPDWDDYMLPIGQADILRAGSDVTLVSYARGLAACEAAADTLAADGISAEIINLRSLRPLDIATIITSVQKTNRLVTVEEGWPVCSIGSEIAARVQADAFDHLDAPILSVQGADVPMPYAENLEALALPHTEQIVAAANKVLYRPSP